MQNKRKSLKKPRRRFLPAIESLESRILLSSAGITITSANPPSWSALAGTTVNGSCGFNVWEGSANSGQMVYFVVGVQNSSGKFVTGTSPFALFSGTPGTNSPGNSWSMNFSGLSVPTTGGTYQVALAEELTTSSTTALADFKANANLASTSIGKLTSTIASPGITVTNSATNTWSTSAGTAISGSIKGDMWLGSNSGNYDVAVVVGIRNSSGAWVTGTEPQELEYVFPPVGSPGQSYSLPFTNLQLPTTAGTYNVVAALEPETDPVLAFEAKADLASATAGKVTTTHSSAIYGPLLGFQTWNQDGPIVNGNTATFNEFCPIDPATLVRSISGCVATAESEILYYWHDVTHISLSSADDYISDSGTSAAVHIDSDSTKDQFPTLATLNTDLATINYSNPTQMAQVAFALGILNNATYTSTETDASITPKLLAACDWGNAEWSNNWTQIEPTIIANIEAGDPVLINFPDHLAVIDGYNKTSGQFHVVLGWGGQDDGWYTLPDPADFAGQTISGEVVGVEYNLVPVVPHVTAPASQTATAGQTKSISLGSFTQSGTTGPYAINIAWGDGTTSKETGITTAGTIPAISHKYTKAGAQSVTVVITDADGDESNTATFNVTVSPAAAEKVVFTEPPTNNASGTTLGTLQVAIEDTYGNVLTTNSTTMTLSIATGSGTLIGTIKVAATKGIATFTKLSLSKSGTYTLTALDGTLHATSANFSVA